MTNLNLNLFNYRCALRTIDTLTTPDPLCPAIRDDHTHDLFARALRDLLTARDYTPYDNDFDPPAYIYDTLRPLLAIIDAYPHSRDDLTKLLLDNSLCPMHAIDYAICFDDETPDCAAIRMIHPSHDT